MELTREYFDKGLKGLDKRLLERLDVRERMAKMEKKMAKIE